MLSQLKLIAVIRICGEEEGQGTVEHVLDFNKGDGPKSKACLMFK